jgi:hypothetical protein
LRSSPPICHHVSLAVAKRFFGTLLPFLSTHRADSLARSTLFRE